VWRAGQAEEDDVRSSGPVTGVDGVKTAREKAEEKRQAKLELVREQVESGGLVIRPMTADERRRYPPRPATPKRGGRK
jgi:adenosylmethionine-8-amino-7-oxononanoate aminotransferase